jgi:streptomycin 6-kinase
VRQGDDPAMLKLAASDDERRGAEVMAWWAGDGGAPVLAYSRDALLMRRADGARNLAHMPDEQALPLFCAVVDALHRPRPDPPATPPLSQLFQALFLSGEPRLVGPRETAKALLADPKDPVVLHADVHHGNVLDFGRYGWLAIDPWGYRGERTYDYANILRNPDLDRVREPGRLQRGVLQIASLAALDPQRLGQWIYAHAGLAAAWDLMDGHDPSRSWVVIAQIEAMRA